MKLKQNKTKQNITKQIKISKNNNEPKITKSQEPENK